MSTVVKDLGAVSAYAYAVEKGYTGTEAEFAELMADYAEVGQRAENAAGSALESKTAAQTAAATATNKASEATTAAQTATTKAGEAQTSAQTASSKASEASQSASQALTYKTDAESAKTASQTAQGLAESARDDAITAKTAAVTAQGKAEDAQAAAEAVAESIPPDYSQLSADVTDLKEDLTDKADTVDMLKSFPTDTASGSVASFADGANVPVKSLIVNIDPVQSGSGDPSPDNIRPISGWSEVNVNACGVNLLNIGEPMTKTAGGLTYTVNADGSVCIQGTTIYGVGLGLAGESGGNPLFYLKKGYKYTAQGANIQINGTTAKASMQAPVTFTAKEGDYVSYVWLYFPQGVTVDATYYPMIAIGTTASPYEPYQGESVTISLGQTVYGGKLDVLSGELTVYPYYASYNGETLTGEWISDRDKYVAGATPTIGAQVVNIGAQGVTVQLSANQLNSLYGQNNLWADSGDTEVEYRADTKLYIAKKIAEALASLT